MLPRWSITAAAIGAIIVIRAIIAIRVRGTLIGDMASTTTKAMVDANIPFALKVSAWHNAKRIMQNRSVSKPSAPPPRRGACLFVCEIEQRSLARCSAVVIFLTQVNQRSTRLFIYNGETT
jgi:hypothetical protein